jgi:hypothetical protein
MTRSNRSGRDEPNTFVPALDDPLGHRDPGLVADHRPDAAVAEVEVELVTLEERVERNDDRPDGGDGEEADDERGRVREQQGDRIAGRDAVGGQPVRQAVDAVRELRICQAFLAVDDGHLAPAGVGMGVQILDQHPDLRGDSGALNRDAR